MFIYIYTSTFPPGHFSRWFRVGHFPPVTFYPEQYSFIRIKGAVIKRRDAHSNGSSEDEQSRAYHRINSVNKMGTAEGGNCHCRKRVEHTSTLHSLVYYAVSLLFYLFLLVYYFKYEICKPAKF